MQQRAFIESEGDAWWNRNKLALEAWDEGTDLPLLLIHGYSEPKRVLEVGASSGYRLACLDSAYRVATDVSADALAYGRERFKGIDFVRASADALPFVGKFFDTVICNFVLHWIDRDHVGRAVDEIDRVLDEHGVLVLGDFLPLKPIDVAYHHREGLFTYKRNYALMFREQGYRAMTCVVGQHADNGDHGSRTGTFVLIKP